MILDTELIDKGERPFIPAGVIPVGQWATWPVGHLIRFMAAARYLQSEY